MSTGDQYVHQLSKYLYDIKKTFKQWNIKLNTSVIASGFIQSLPNYSLFIEKLKDKIVVVLAYGDDLLLTGSDEALIQHTKDQLQHAFKIKDLRKLRYFLGIEFAKSKERDINA